MKFRGIGCLLIVLAFLSCTRGGEARSAAASGGASAPRVLAVETFLADIVRSVAGDAVTVEALLPPGADPHSFQPSPRDAAVVARADLVIENGGGLEGFLQKLVENVSAGKRSSAPKLVSASEGLTSRTAKEGEAVEAGTAHDADPHYWMDPLLVIHYVDTIAAALSSLDPADTAGFEARAAAYKEKLRELDAWIASNVSRLPADRRILVTNHESLGYFADRYGFTVVGTVIPGTSSEASPSARQMAELIRRLRALKPGAIFVEVGTNRQLALQVAADAGVGKVLELYDHSLTPPDGPAPTYVDMMRYDVKTIVDGLMGG